MKRTLTGPNGVKLHIDDSKAHKDDPGADTPALVEYRGKWGTYWCVADTGDCDGVTVPPKVSEWLNSDGVVDVIEAINWS